MSPTVISGQNEQTKGIILGIGDMVISSNTRDTIIIPNLGSCLGVVAYDPLSQIGGGIHCLSPLGSAEPEKARANPTMFVDTGVALFLNELISAGALKHKLLIVAAGCASINDPNNIFEIGKKNHTIFRRLVWKNNLLIAAEEVGGGSPRTVHLKMDKGSVTITSQGIVKQVIK
jgi:chemotaxis protein CheD